MRKTAGNAVELGSIAAFGFSPLWLLAAGADVTHGTRVYLDAFVQRAEGRRRARRGGRPAIGRRAPRGSRGGLRHGGAADRHPTARARRAASLPRRPARRRERPAPAEGDGRALRRAPGEAVRERRSLLEVSTGVGIAFFNSARHVGRQHVLDPYGEDLKPLRDEGFGAYAARVSRPYGAAVARHFDPEQASLTERGIDKLRGGALREPRARSSIRAPRVRRPDRRRAGTRLARDSPGPAGGRRRVVGTRARARASRWPPRVRRRRDDAARSSRRSQAPVAMGARRGRDRGRCAPGPAGRAGAARRRSRARRASHGADPPGRSCGGSPGRRPSRTLLLLLRADPYPGASALGEIVARRIDNAESEGRSTPQRLDWAREGTRAPRGLRRLRPCSSTATSTSGTCSAAPDGASARSTHSRAPGIRSTTPRTGSTARAAPVVGPASTRLRPRSPSTTTRAPACVTGAASSQSTAEHHRERRLETAGRVHRPAPRPRAAGPPGARPARPPGRRGAPHTEPCS